MEINSKSIFNSVKIYQKECFELVYYNLHVIFLMVFVFISVISYFTGKIETTTKGKYKSFLRKLPVKLTILCIYFQFGRIIFFLTCEKLLKKFYFFQDDDFSDHFNNFSSNNFSSNSFSSNDFSSNSFSSNHSNMFRISFLLLIFISFLFSLILFEIKKSDLLDFYTLFSYSFYVHLLICYKKVYQMTLSSAIEEIFLSIFCFLISFLIGFLLLKFLQIFSKKEDDSE